MIFEGTSKYYNKYRPKYPRKFYRDFVRKLCLSKNKILLDIGSGPGLLFIPITNYVKKIYALDQEIEMIKAGSKTCKVKNINNVEWINCSAENISKLKLPKVDIVTFGNSFLWVDRESILNQLDLVVKPTGKIILIQRKSFWDETVLWKSKVLEIIKTYTNDRRLTLDGVFDKSYIDNSVFFFKSKFCQLSTESIIDHKLWTKESFKRFLLTNSFASSALLGKNKSEFLKKIDLLWGSISVDNKIIENIEYEIIWASRE
jgi:ubiquinone/menaquinone biosynthesis C-methylase UbiE